MRAEVKPDFGGPPYNPEPATDPQVTRKIDFESCGQQFEMSIGIPLYMWKKLKSSDWDQVEKWVKERADSVRVSEAMKGNLLRWKDTLEGFARTCIYNQFSKQQVNAGNDSWAAPAGF